MIIAINTRSISGNEQVNVLLINHILRLALIHPEHQFVLISHKEIQLSVNPTNVKQYLLTQQSDNVLLWKLWYHYKLPAALRKLKADVLLSTDGILSKRVKVPQYLLVSDVGFLSFPELYAASYVRFAKLNSREFFYKARKLIVLSDFIKKEIVKHYKVNEAKILTWQPGVTPLLDISKAEQVEAIKSQFTNGKDYLFFYGSLEDKSRLLNLLKAFSIFKKRLKTNMLLLLATPYISQENALVKSLSMYKYRDDVKLIPANDEQTLAGMRAAAYACINLSPAAGDSIFLLQALQSGTPVIAGNYHAVIALLNNAALFADPLSVDAIAEKIMMLYKDEKKRSELIQNGFLQADQYKEENAAAQLASLLFQ